MKAKDYKWMIAQIQKRKQELADESEKANSIDRVKEIGNELDQLNIKFKECIDALLKLSGEEDDEDDNTDSAGTDPDARSCLGLRTQLTPAGPFNVLGTYGIGGNKINNNEVRTMILSPEMKKKLEQRGADLKAHNAINIEIDEMELRAITIASDTLAVPKHTSDAVNPAFNEVSTVIDAVHAVPLSGGEAYEKGFVVSYGEGGYTDETSNYTDAEPTFDYVSIGKAKITAYAEMTDEATKLPSAQYAVEVKNAIMQAIRKKISRQIVAGAGTANTLTGIFKAPSNVIPLETDLVVAEINEDTLDDLVLAYGGDEEIEGDAYLILSKEDLAAFAKVRDAEGKKLYTIKKTSGATGVISSEGTFETPYIINSACPALSAATTATGTYCMAYGKLMAYEMPVFSPLTVEESRDYKFKSGHVAYRGSVWTGGNVAMYKGFIRVKKA